MRMFLIGKRKIVERTTAIKSVASPFGLRSGLGSGLKLNWGYDRCMRRALQIGTWLFLLVMFLSPLAEYFDRWDAPGISSDTEFAVFALAFLLCLVLVVCLLVAARSLLHNLVLEPRAQLPSDERSPTGAKVLPGIFVPPRLLSLRI
jgi:hypothetical protein